MSLWLTSFFAAVFIGFGTTIWLIVVAFRTSVAWGFITWFVPFGNVIFVGKHWGKAGVPFLLSFAGFAGCEAIYFLHPEPFAPYLKQYPALQAATSRVKLPAFLVPTPPPAPPGKPEKREAVDVAATDSIVAQRDSLLLQQDAYDKHAAELSATYEQLKTARAKLKGGGGPALAAYNAKAAHYQDACRTLATEKARLDALQHNVGVATAKAKADTQTVANTAAGDKSDGPPATRAAMDVAIQRVQAIVNQVPPAVSKPTGAESWNYGFHPGATKPDFDSTDIVSGRELWPHDYIDMQGSPNVYYRGTDCEFNSQTKFFYTNRAVPKKRLTDVEYQELVRLYRFLGKCQRDLGVNL